ncbi:MAG: NAD(P)H-hydrate dehydratase [Candidatus Micrarchaeia archaeon]
MAISVSKGVLKKVFPKRKDWARKGGFGRLLVVGGSKRFHGSPVFNSLSAYRAGCDLVFLAAPRRAADLAATFSPSIITYPLEGDYFSPAHVEQVLQLSRDYSATAMVVGGGMWRELETFVAIRELIRKTNLPTVVDADAIRAVAQTPEVLRGKKCILTPHSEEFRVLSGITVSSDVAQRAIAAQKVAQKLGATILLKGHVDVISDGKQTALNKTGTPFMTKGGFGDCLAGICGSFLARGVAPFDAACAAAFLNGKAGELAAKEKGEGLMPMDAVEKVHTVLKNAG